MKKAEDAGAVKDEITGKTIREMSWDELLSLPATERLTTEQAMQRMKEARVDRDKSQSA
ncbi:hypothetical protein CLV58_1499 [Spirosoma oryzae]|uniref:Uncharacterized protein n=1 Tax=Spirosoma oryzae TaxID=1469603 RepID=A0A2T0RKR9_9BACT|nr:hypothetical protein [Spirosoma oryzae]PRY21721.1 hypothetical protein CLV58_1499 [Spirosoma oryzae]